MTAEEYRQRMIQAFHNADCDHLIAIVVQPKEKEFEHLEWLLKTHYKNVLEQIRAEIERVFCMSVVTNELRTPMEVKTEILQIIDKYKGEKKMKMIIDIADYIVESVRNENVCKYEKFKIFEAIKNGTPLVEQVRADFDVDESRTELEKALDSLHVEQERIELLRIFAEVENFDFIREMSSEQLWKLMFIAFIVLDVGKEKRNKE